MRTKPKLNNITMNWEHKEERVQGKEEIGHANTLTITGYTYISLMMLNIIRNFHFEVAPLVRVSRSNTLTR